MKKMTPQIAVGVMVIDKDRILLGKRCLDVPAGGCWCIPIGRLEWGETLKECGFRELKEESGLIAKELKTISLHNVILPQSHYLTITYLAEGIEGEPKVTSPEEITKWDWFDMNMLPKPLLYPIEDMIRAYNEYKNVGLPEGIDLNKWVIENIDERM